MTNSDAAITTIIESHRDKSSGRIPRSLTAPLLERLAGCRRKQAGDLLHQAHDADDARMLDLVQQQAQQISTLTSQVAELLARLDACQQQRPTTDDDSTQRKADLAIAGVQASAEVAVTRAREGIERATEHWAGRIRAVEDRLHRIEHWAIREIGSLRRQSTNTEISLGWVCAELIAHLSLPLTTEGHLTLVAQMKSKPIGKAKMISQRQRVEACRAAALATWTPIAIEDEPLFGAVPQAEERFEPRLGRAV